MNVFIFSNVKNLSKGTKNSIVLHPTEIPYYFFSHSTQLVSVRYFSI